MIRLDNLSLSVSSFPMGPLCLTVGEGDFFVLMGPTGAGKTLLLEAIAGLVPVADGRIFIGARDVTRLPPERREVGIVYQDQSLFPHLTVRENIRYGLRFKNRTGPGTEALLDRLVEELRIGHLLERRPLHLSGGERQRVALVRALAVQPSLLLLDEPLSALDPAFREEMGGLLRRIRNSTGATFIMVTHDFTEALALGNRGAVMNRGRLEQVGEVRDIFLRPASPFVARFVGMKNLFRARFQGPHALVRNLRMRLPRPQGRESGKVAFRPEHVEIWPESARAPHPNLFSGTIAECVDHGFTCRLTVSVDSVRLTAHLPAREAHRMGLCEGRRVTVAVPPEAIHVI
jgi:molybdate/tungstate transport system ATP-binding protein